MVNVSQAVCRGFASLRVMPNTIMKMVQTASLLGTQAYGWEFDSAARPCKRPGSVWNCQLGNALQRSPGINRKSRESYPDPGFLPSTTWPSMPKKHSNGLINRSIMELISVDRPTIKRYSQIVYKYFFKSWYSRHIHTKITTPYDGINKISFTTGLDRIQRLIQKCIFNDVHFEHSEVYVHM